ncbi:helix-turn-helix domain-containing protein [Paenibacillus hamazuiensis]|uniref:helix-turn-helix domain-containing protein n=1 Tax=Paenibacillus hamazuiensis TaxID=2936508 RepID=UPI00200CFC9A|nr:helix-turn-helix domain-containing protein [Paenibacillus hamazuiensis]
MWKIKRRASGHRLFLRLMVPNMLFLLLPLLVGWVIYNKTLVEMEKEVTAGNMHLLRMSRDILDRRVSEIGTIAMQLAADTRIMQFQTVTEPFKGANTYKILETRKSIYNHSLTNNFLFNYFVIYKNSDLVLAEDSTYTLSDFYNNFRVGQMDRQSWKSLFTDSFYHQKVFPAQEVTVKGNKYSLVTFVQSLGYQGYPQGAVVITVDNREIQKLLGGFDLSGGGMACIIDERGTVISALSKDSFSCEANRVQLGGGQGNLLADIGDRKMIVTFTKSGVNGWTYMVAQPAHVVLQKVLYIKKITFAMAFLFLTIGLLIAYLIAYRNSRPLRHIVETITERMEGETSPGADAYRFIRESVARLIDSNHELQEKINHQSPYLQAALFERLLKGEYLSPKDTPVLLQHVGIETQGKYFVAAVVQLQGYNAGLDRDALEELDVKRVRLKDVLHEEWNTAVYWHDVAEDQIALLFAFGPEHPAESMNVLDEALRRACDTIRQRLELTARIAVGGVYENLPNIARSYEEAKRTLEYMEWTNAGGIMRYGELPQENSSYYYPSDLEMRLTNLAKAGEQAQVEDLLQELYRINFEQRRLPVAMLQMYIHEMWGTLIKLLPQVGMNESLVLEKMMPLSGGKVSFDVLERSYRSLACTFKHVCEVVNERKKSQNVLLLEKIEKLLNESYAKPDLCLDVVADELNISKGYLSQFFKEQKGIGFSDYLENLRMSEAKMMLARTDLPVGEIAQQVGYSSANTFCRAFKRLYGVSALAFRRSTAF